MKTLSLSPALTSAMATRLSQSPDAIRHNEKQLRNGELDRQFEGALGHSGHSRHPGVSGFAPRADIRPPPAFMLVHGLLLASGGLLGWWRRRKIA